MRRIYALVAAIVLAACLAMVAYTGSAAAPPASFAVKIDMPDGHGSGAHIGRGYILTAAHVAEQGEADVVTDTGTRRRAEILWINKDFDIALLRIADYEDIAVVPLSCSPLPVGTRYTAYGSPSQIDFVSAAGEVVGPAQKRWRWASAVVVNGAMINGMSGGPVVVGGRLVGVAVGTQLHAAGGMFPSFTGFGFVVPSQIVCALMAR